MKFHGELGKIIGKYHVKFQLDIVCRIFFFSEENNFRDNQLRHTLSATVTYNNFLSLQQFLIEMYDDQA